LTPITGNKVFSSLIILSCLLSSCAAPFRAVPEPSQGNIIVSKSSEKLNQEQPVDQENFEVKKAKKPGKTPLPSISPTEKPTALPTVTPVPVTNFAGDRIISFSGNEWLVRNSNGFEGPGPNMFSNSTDNVYLDQEGQLHLKIVKRDNKWYCAEINSLKSLGYGTYRFYLASRVDQLPSNVVLGLFTYDSNPDYNHREIDIEFSKWGDPSIVNSQFVVQPYETGSNINRFDSNLTGDFTTQSFSWNPNKISFESFYGHYQTAPDNDFVVNSWNYSGTDVPVSGDEKVSINLWNFEGRSPASEIEVVIKKFEFIPAGSVIASK
jgi:hypothetical protein